MVSRRLGTRLLLSAVVVLSLLRYVGGVSWGMRAALSLLLATAVWRLGIGFIRPLQVSERHGTTRDVVDPEGIPTYRCKTCGTQLVLLRQGTDKAPRHCGEPMAFELVEPERSSEPPVSAAPAAAR
ncbi:MAG: hypothetical protein ABR520_12810 [Mycobacteriales bacterium]|nr:hypothetical protein [Frankia sp.]